MCGIFGMSTNKVENLDVNAVHILGIFNIERGKMSCGYHGMVMCNTV